MPLYVDSDDVIQHITFGDQIVAERPLKYSWTKQLIDNLWFLVCGRGK